MRKIIPLLIFSFPIFNSFGQITFQKLITSEHGSTANAVEQTTDGGYIVVGSISRDDTTNQNNDVYLIKTNNQGAVTWTRTFGGINNNIGYSVQQTVDGGYIIAGFSDSLSYTSNLYIIKTDAGGDTLWTKTYGPSNADNGGTYRSGLSFVQQTYDRGYIISGTATSFGTNILSAVYLLKIDANGNITWSKTYIGSLDLSSGYCVKQTSDSGYIICGITEWGLGNSLTDVYLIKTNVNGDILWSKAYGGNADDVGYSVQQTTDSGYIVVGYTMSFDANSDVYLIKTNVNGDPLWTKTYGGNGYSDNSGYSVRQTTDGGYIIAGFSFNFIAEFSVYLIKTKSNGDTLWTQTYGGTSSDGIYSVRQTTDGGYIFAGSFDSLQLSKESIYLIKTDIKGNSGCNQGIPITIVASPATQVAVINSAVYSGGTTIIPSITIVGIAGKDSTLCLSVGIDEIRNNNTISIYPNPATNQLTLHSSSFKTNEVVTISVMNVLGEIVQNEELKWSSEISINIKSIPGGIYFVEVRNGERQYIQKVVIQ